MQIEKQLLHSYKGQEIVITRVDGKSHLLAYKLTQKTTGVTEGSEIEPRTQTPRVVSSEGVTTWDQWVDFFKTGPHAHVGQALLEIPGFEGGDALAVAPLQGEYKEQFLAEGSYHAWSRSNLAVKKPFTSLQKGQTFDLVLTNGQLAWALDGTPIPQMLLFEYIDDATTNRWWHLKKLVRILMGRADVTIRANGGQKVWMYDDQAPRDDPRHWIGDIPSYNADENCSRCIEFGYRPTQKDWEKALRHAWDNRRGGGAPSLRDIKGAVIELDILGTSPARRSKE